MRYLHEAELYRDPRLLTLDRIDNLEMHERNVMHTNLFFQQQFSAIMAIFQETRRFNSWGEGKRFRQSVYVVEFQARGIPHYHILIWLNGLPDIRTVERNSEDEKDLFEWVDSLITVGKYKTIIFSNPVNL